MYETVESATNAEAAAQCFERAMQSADAGDMHKAVRLLERAMRLQPGSEKYTREHALMRRQLEAVLREQSDYREHEGASASGGKREPGGAHESASSSRGGERAESENVDTDDSSAAGARSWEARWLALKDKLSGLRRGLSRSASRVGSAALAVLPRDEQQADRLAYLFFYWRGRLRVPLILTAIFFVLRLCVQYPWSFFFLVCAAAVPLGAMIARGLELSWRVTGAALGAHVLFVWSCPYASAYLYGALLWLALALLFRGLALIATAVLLLLWFLPWTMMRLFGLALLLLFGYAMPIPTVALTVSGVMLRYVPWTFFYLLAVPLSGFFTYHSRRLSVPIGLGHLAVWFLPRVVGGLVLLAGAVLLWRSRRLLLQLLQGTFEFFFGQGPPQTNTPRPSDAAAAVRHVMSASTHYEVLAVSSSPSLSEIRSSYKRMALYLHPDKNSDPNAPAAFKRLTDANECISNPRARAAYDLSLIQGFEPSDDESEGEEQPPPPRHRGQGGNQRGGARHHRAPHSDSWSSDSPGGGRGRGGAGRHHDSASTNPNRPRGPGANGPATPGSPSHGPTAGGAAAGSSPPGGGGGGRGGGAPHRNHKKRRPRGGGNQW